MFVRLARLAFSLLLAIAPVVASTAIAFPIEQPAPSRGTLTQARYVAGAGLGQSNAAPRPTSGLPSGPFEIQRPFDSVRRPNLQLLAAGAPQTITVQVVPNTLVANSGATAIITATVYDSDNNVVSGATLTGTVTAGRGSVSSFPPTDLSGQTTGIWTAATSSTVGTGAIGVFTNTVSGLAPITLTAGSPTYLTVLPVTAVITAGQRIAFTAIATDTFGNPLGDVTSGTLFGIAPGSGGAFVGNAITPTLKGTFTVTGTTGPAVATASLVVTPTTFSRLSIENAPNGTGTPVNTYFMTVYDSLTVYAVAYDVYSNTIGSQTANWGATGAVAGNIAPTANSISTTFTAALSGTGTITATAAGIPDSTGLITVQAPLLRISKSDSPDPVTPGAQLHYTIRYTNTSPFAAQGVVITETYPLSVTYNHALPGPTSGNNVWSIGSFAGGASSVIDAYVDVPSQMPVGSVLTNTVQIGALRAATAIYTATTPVNAQPILNADILDSSDPVRPGQVLVYTILYRNDGNAPASGLRITETYPSQVTYVSANPPPSVGNNVWLTNTLNGGGTSRLILVTVNVNSPLADGTLINNRVAIDSNETAPFTVTEPTLVTAPALQLTKSANPVSPAANSLLTYTLRYTNTGSSYASGIVITDALPANSSFVRCEPDVCGGSSVVTWSPPGQLLQQTSNAVTLTVQVANNLPNGTILTNTARITSAEQVSATASLTTTVGSTPEVTLSKSDGLAQVAAGQLATYTLSFANVGSAPAANVVITDRIPDYTTFVGCSSCVPAGSRVYSFTLSTLDASQNGAVTISLGMSPTLPAGLRAITNTAVIATSTSGDKLTNNVAQDVDNVATRPGLDLGVNYDSTTPYPGKIITYTLRYTNTSDMDTIGVVITTTRPAWLTGTLTGWTSIDSTDVYSVGNLAARQSGIITYVVTLPKPYTLDMNAFISTFFIEDGGPGGLPKAQDQSTAFIGVPDLSVAPFLIPTSVAPNTGFTVTVVVSNTGLGSAYNPKNRGGFYVDAFVDPLTRPPSNSFTPNNFFAGMPPLGAGLTATVIITNIVFTTTQRPLLYFKVDNFDCSPLNGKDPCLPSHSSGGLVPEYNEDNNVSDPVLVPRYAVYLPLVRKSRP